MGNEEITYNPNFYNNSNKSRLNFKLELSKIDYFEDEFIEGEVQITPFQTIVLSKIIIKIKCIYGWVKNVKNSNTISQSEINSLDLTEMTLNVNQCFNIATELVSLNPGSMFRFPFKLQIGKKINPSFEYAFEEKKCYCRHLIRAEILSPFIKNFYDEKILFIKNKPFFIENILSGSQNDIVYKWGLFKKGSTILNMKIPNNNFKFKEIIPIIIDIDNTKGGLNVNNIKIAIIRTMILKKKGKEIYTYKEKITAKNNKHLVEIGQKKLINLSIPIVDEVININLQKNSFLPYSSIKDFTILIPSIESDIFICRYYVKASVYFENFVNYANRPRVSIPIYISYLSQKEKEYLDQENNDLQRALKESMIDSYANNNNNMINNGYNNSNDNNYNYNMDIINNGHNYLNNNDVNNNQINNIVMNSNVMNNDYNNNNNNNNVNNINNDNNNNNDNIYDSQAPFAIGLQENNYNNYNNINNNNDNYNNINNNDNYNNNNYNIINNSHKNSIDNFNFNEEYNFINDNNNNNNNINNINENNIDNINNINNMNNINNINEENYYPDYNAPPSILNQ